MSLKEGIRRTRERLADGLSRIFSRRSAITPELWEETENLLLEADVGVEATATIVANLEKRAARKSLPDAAAFYSALRDELLFLLEPVSVPLAITREATSPFVVLMVGVNGTGKTTTVGKLAKRWKSEGYSVALAAADTFRAAAVDQLVIWSERHGIPITVHRDGGDPAAVAYEAFETAKARKTDVLLVDTAGRLHTQGNLMEQLKKVRRVLSKLDSAAPHETLLVLDATTGQNAVTQATQFQVAVGVSGIVLTKLDGTAKGGIVCALATGLKVPIRYVGVGEQADDLMEFQAGSFVDALIGL
jgi:fused signal recognition particle receptor